MDEGELVGGRYRLREVLGAGGMGRVWLADDQLLRRPVAVKEMLGAVADRVDIQLRTVREARAAARLDHPAVVKVFDVVWFAERAWIVMEYVRSRSLYAAVLADGPIGHREAARIGLRVLAGLRAAHGARVLHLDVKPHNVLLADDGRVVLGDFGLAVIADPDGEPEAELMGSPYYVAPERIRPDGRPSPATDLWSLGATLYAAIEGRPPFLRASTDESLRAVLHEDPDPAVNGGPLVPLLYALLAKNRDDRPRPVELERRLRQIAESPVRGRAVVAPSSLMPSSPMPPVSAPRPRTGRRRTGLVLAGAAVVLAGSAGTAIALDDQRVDSPAIAATVAPAAGLSTGPAAGLSAAPAGPRAASGGVCGFGVASSVVQPATSRVPAGLPSGWIWFRDPTGFALALPAGWQRSMSGTVVCFQEPQGDGAFTVDSAALVTRRPLNYFQSQEKAGRLPGYRRISLDNLLLRRGGADWEYTWRPDSDTVQHERRVLLAVTDRRSYLLKWTTSDAGWTSSLRLERQLVTFFDSAA